MAELSVLNRIFPKFSYRNQAIVYILLGLILNSAIWGVVIFYLTVAPKVYSSKTSINLPGASSNTSVDLQGIGGTSVQSASPYAGSKEPRENYKFIATNEPVIKEASKALGITSKEFGIPRVTILDGTTIMQFELTGKSPEEAQKKAITFYEAFEDRLNQLRLQEAMQREDSFLEALSSSKEKLEIAQKRLSEYKMQSGLSSQEQLKDLATNIEFLRRSEAELIAQQGGMGARLQQLTSNLNLSSKQATNSLLLQADQIYQRALKDYSDSSADLITLRAKYTPKNPKIIRVEENQKAALETLLKRAQYLLGEPNGQVALDQLNLSSNVLTTPSARETLLKELILAQTEQQGYYVQAKELERQIASLEGRLTGLVQEETKLDALQGNVQIAQTIFSSKATQLDLSRSNIFDSYPLVQVLTKPELPSKPSSPKKLIVIAGALFGSLLVSGGLLSLWFYKRKLKEDSSRSRVKIV